MLLEDGELAVNGNFTFAAVDETPVNLQGAAGQSKLSMLGGTIVQN